MGTTSLKCEDDNAKVLEIIITDEGITLHFNQPTNNFDVQIDHWPAIKSYVDQQLEEATP